MDKEIKRLLSLSSIPGFKLLASEQRKLDEWKAQQVKVKPKKVKRTARKTTAKPSYNATALTRVQNVVPTTTKETGEIEDL